MKRKEKITPRRKKKKLKIDFIIGIIYLLSCLYLIYSLILLSNIENTIRYIFIGLLLFSNLIYFYCSLKRRKQSILLSLIGLLFSALFIFTAFNINKIYSKLNKFNKKVTNEIVLVTRKDNKIEETSNIENETIYFIGENEQKKLSLNLIKKYHFDKLNKIKETNSHREMLNNLLTKKANYVILPHNYIEMYESEFKNLKAKTKIIATYKEVKEKNKDLLSNAKIDKPLTFLLLGIDSSSPDISKLNSFQGDTIIVATFNPSTLNTTILSIPRDSYVPIACLRGQPEDKITHTAHYGTKCIIDTVQNFLDVKIDYYAKINFLGLVKLVDALGGITVDVPYALCEQNSARNIRSSALIYIEQGVQNLNGEQALALSRNRHKNNRYDTAGVICKSSKYTEHYRDDFSRGKNQQLVIQGIINKALTIRDLNTLYKILDTIGNNMDTNMTTETMLSFYNLAKEIVLSSNSTERSHLFTLDHLAYQGSSQMIYNENAHMKLYQFIPNEDSVNEVKKAIKDNLDTNNNNLIKEFYYNPSSPYVKKIPGESNSYHTKQYNLVPNFIGLTKNDALIKARKVGLTINFEEIEGKNLKVFYQEYPEGKRVDSIKNKTIILKIGKEKKIIDTRPDCLEDSLNPVCKIPNFINKKPYEVTKWLKSFSKPLITVTYKNEEEIIIPQSDLDKYGTISKQSPSEGKNIKDIKTITITLKKKES